MNIKEKNKRTAMDEHELRERTEQRAVAKQREREGREIEISSGERMWRRCLCVTIHLFFSLLFLSFSFHFPFVL